MNVSELAKRERMPELHELLSSIENVANKYDLMSVDIKNKIEQIYCRPATDISLGGSQKEVCQPNDLIGSIWQQLDRLKMLSERYEYLLDQLSKIV